MKSKKVTPLALSISLRLVSADCACQIFKQIIMIKLYMETKKSFRYIGKLMALVILSSPLAIGHLD